MSSIQTEHPKMELKAKEFALQLADHIEERKISLREALVELDTFLRGQSISDKPTSNKYGNWEIDG